MMKNNSKRKNRLKSKHRSVWNRFEILLYLWNAEKQKVQNAYLDRFDHITRKLLCNSTQQ